MAKAVRSDKEFYELAQKASEIRLVEISRGDRAGQAKLKLRTPSYLYTLSVKDLGRANTILKRVKKDCAKIRVLRITK